jgi:hypothetical protein
MKPKAITDALLQIFDAEIELENTCKISTLNRLLELYKEVIEYYEDVSSPQMWDFQERLQKLLMKPSVLKMVQEESLRHSYKQNRKQLKVVKNAQETEKTLSRANTAPEHMEIIDKNLKENKIAGRIVETQQRRTEHVSIKAVSDIKSQEHSLSERLANRKGKLMNLSMQKSFLSISQVYGINEDISTEFVRKNKAFFETESDKSAGISRFGEFYEKIEKIIEESSNEKTERITEIHVQYETQIRELEAEGGVCLQIAADLKKKMISEISAAKQSVDNSRKQKIRAAKASFI